MKTYQKKLNEVYDKCIHVERELDSYTIRFSHRHNLTITRCLKHWARTFQFKMAQSCTKNIRYHSAVHYSIARRQWRSSRPLANLSIPTLAVAHRRLLMIGVTRMVVRLVVPMAVAHRCVPIAAPGFRAGALTRATAKSSGAKVLANAAS